MRLLVDTNIFLEALLEQARSDEAKELLAKTDTHDLFISDFSLHSVGLILLRRNQADARLNPRRHTKQHEAGRGGFTPLLRGFRFVVFVSCSFV